MRAPNTAHVKPMPRHPKPPPLSLDPRASLGGEDRREAVLLALERLRRAWPEPLALNIRARTVSELVRDLGMPLSVVREALARLDSGGAIEKARMRTVAGATEVSWAAVCPRKLTGEQKRRWAFGRGSMTG